MWSLKIVLCGIIVCMMPCGSSAFQVTLDSAPAQPSPNASTVLQRSIPGILSPPPFHPQYSDGHSERVFRFRQPIRHVSKPIVPKRGLMVDAHSNHAKTTVADETAQNEVKPLWVSDWSLACVLLLACVGGGYFLHRYCEFLQIDMQEKDVQEKGVEAIPISKEDMQADSSEEEVFSPTSTETSTSISISTPQQGMPGSGPTIHGTKGRMGMLPPTAQASIGPVPAKAQSKSWSFSKRSLLASISESAQLASTDCMTSSSSESSTLFLPPALSPDFAESCKDGTFLWTILPDLCHAFVLGSPIEVQGSPSLHARLATNAGGQSRIEMGTVKDFIAADVIIGPLNPCSSSGVVAELIGPDGQVYGSFSRNGDAGFVVTHTSRAGNVLSLDPVTTSKGSFLEIAAEGHPVCLVQLNDPTGKGVEIDSDPDVDAFLIVSCVLASLVAAPELLPAICNPPQPGS